MNQATIAAINSARYFQFTEPYKAPQPRPWQYVLMEYERVRLTPPAHIPDFQSLEDAQIWLCLDSRYNMRLRELAEQRMAV